MNTISNYETCEQTVVTKKFKDRRPNYSKITAELD